MKKHYGKYLAGISMFLLLGFMPAKYSADFKKNKEKIKTLTILNPIVHIVANNNRVEFIDTTLTKVNQKLVDSITHGLLIKKYTLEKALLPLMDYNRFTTLFEQLENSPKTIGSISSKPLFNNSDIEFKSKYALLLVYYGQYHPDFPPHFKFTAAAVTGTIILTPNNPTKSIADLRLLVIDTENEEVVFYDRINSAKYDARISNEVRQMTKTILRKIYYK
jgi:hypothetical protein